MSDFKLIFIIPAEECGYLSIIPGSRDNRPVFDESPVFQNQMTVFENMNGTVSVSYQRGLKAKKDYIDFDYRLETLDDLKWTIFHALVALSPVIAEVKRKCYRMDSDKLYKERTIALRDCIYELVQKTTKSEVVLWAKYPKEKQIWMEGIKKFEIKYLGKPRSITSNYIFRKIKYYFGRVLSWM